MALARENGVRVKKKTYSRPTRRCRGMPLVRRRASRRGQEQGRQTFRTLLEILLVFTRKRDEGVGRERKRGGDLYSGVGVIKRLMLSSNTANTCNQEASSA
jgi:hypothetical protein